VLVVAHPDDEALWFSSLLSQVGRVIVCFGACDDFPELGPARRAALAEHPLSRLHWLRLPEPCSVAAVDWDDPVETSAGLALNARSDPERQRRYERSFSALLEGLRDELAEAGVVYTHNPWGEYGHPDHVQVSRVVTTLQQSARFELWFSSYVSARSMPLAARHLERLMRHFILPVDAEYAERLRQHYSEHGAWTWHLDYVWPEREAFLQETEERSREGANAPLTCVRT